MFASTYGQEVLLHQTRAGLVVAVSVLTVLSVNVWIFNIYASTALTFAFYQRRNHAILISFSLQKNSIRLFHDLFAFLYSSFYSKI